jgi:hypothetical protein
MPVSLDFDTSHYYTTAAEGIDVPIALCVGRESVELLAKLDTGAAHCIFERRYAEIRCRVRPAPAIPNDGRIVRCLSTHEVTIQTLGLEFSAAIFFALDPTFSRNFRGRSGWLDRLRIAIVDYDRMLFVSPYQS